MKKVMLTKVRELNKDETAPPQVIAILASMKVGVPIDREELGKTLVDPKTELRLATKQDPARVIAFYQARLVQAGVFKEERTGVTNIVARQPKQEPTAPTAPATTAPATKEKAAAEATPSKKTA